MVVIIGGHGIVGSELETLLRNCGVTSILKVGRNEPIPKSSVYFLAAGKEASKTIIPTLPESSFVIDLSSAHRDVFPLILPEANSHLLKSLPRRISTPNCIVSILLTALAPLHKTLEIESIYLSTYQAASGAGNIGMNDLKESIKEQMLKNKVPESKIFSHPLGFNIIPHIDEFQENLYTKEEMKVVWEIRKILDAPNLPVSCTAVRIPTLRAHSESITVETLYPINYDLLNKEYTYLSGISVVDDPEKNIYPMPLTATNRYDVEVGRIRPSLIFGDYGLDLFVSGDQLLRGAALNAVLIAKSIID